MCPSHGLKGHTAKRTVTAHTRLSHLAGLCPTTGNSVPSLVTVCSLEGDHVRNGELSPHLPECRVSPWDSYALEAHLFGSLCFGICFCFPFILIFFQSFIYFNMGLHIGLSSNTTLFCHSAFHFWPLGTRSWHLHRFDFFTFFMMFGLCFAGIYDELSCSPPKMVP